MNEPFTFLTSTEFLGLMLLFMCAFIWGAFAGYFFAKDSDNIPFFDYLIMKFFYKRSKK
ncbi:MULTISPECIES: hypothetical protein [unclassified Campylobacter]|uniref:hypothetical protein n=1 Tax=unclassified Campylobacter TaxID=2593542 RepID=UPI0022E9D617|nr:MULTISPECIES: hypothetical protein [unclassified Campylobacter]MDA3056459.1 hypothetical protein [Campylobacter sp. CN_NA1]MDA3069390.1 hypothetical protein [Campylobacter sp. CN_NE3]